MQTLGGDLAAPDTLSAALDGVDAVFLVFPSVTADHAAQLLVTRLTQRARRIVYLSSHGVPDEPDQQAEPDGSILGSHAHLEGLIAASAAEHTFLRASGFAANTWAGPRRSAAPTCCAGSPLRPSARWCTRRTSPRWACGR
jgi:uncharacterized protein YbjT (DUF2867 family)